VPNFNHYYYSVAVREDVENLRKQPKQREAFMEMDVFISKYGIKADTCSPIRHNPYYPTRLSSGMDSWKVPLVNSKGQRHLVYVSKSFADMGTLPRFVDTFHQIAQELAELSKLPNDYPYWAKRLGYDQQEEQTKKLFATMQRRLTAMKKFLGAEGYDIMINNAPRWRRSWW
jgi:hypothetical protein